VAFADRILVLDGGAIARWDRTELILADRDWLAARRLIY
jgi:ABC-type multidrug transport system fused ATPase/permease subunit